MQLLIILCFIAGALASQDCPANSHYNDCGTACPLTCDNYRNPPKACVLMCVPGCHCDPGYVKNGAGSCVLPEQCENHSVNELCGENEEYASCGSACPLTCDNFNNPPKICPLMCVIGCQCKKGYVKTNNGRCVLPENCPSRARVFEVNSCLEKPDGGMCRGRFPMYYYDASSGECHEFVYGGCQGNGNRFASEEECLNRCSTTRVWEAKPEACDQPIERGECLALIHRYAYDKELGRCVKFVYGGCRGNSNNFISEEDCNEVCGESKF